MNYAEAVKSSCQEILKNQSLMDQPAANASQFSLFKEMPKELKYKIAALTANSDVHT